MTSDHRPPTSPTGPTLTRLESILGPPSQPFSLPPAPDKPAHKTQNQHRLPPNSCLPSPVACHPRLSHTLSNITLHHSASLTLTLFSPCRLLPFSLSISYRQFHLTLSPPSSSSPPLSSPRSATPTGRRTGQLWRCTSFPLIRPLLRQIQTPSRPQRNHLVLYSINLGHSLTSRLS